MKAVSPNSQLQHQRTSHAKMMCPTYVTCCTVTGCCCFPALTTTSCRCCCCSCGGWIAGAAPYCGVPYPGCGGLDVQPVGVRTEPVLQVSYR